MTLLIRLNSTICQANRHVHYLRSRLLIPNFNQNINSKKKKETADSSRDLNSNESKSISCQILENNGFISDSNIGLSTQMFLGKRVMNKLTNLVREEMNKIQGQEIEMSSLCDLSLWDKSERNKLIGNELFRLNDRNNRQLCLCPTHEEVVTSLVSKYGKIIANSCLGDENSLRLYQITRKYRDEPRPKHGLLRTREFLMKDMYSFHTNMSCAEKTYDEVCKSYEAIMERLDLKYKKVRASTGAMGGKKSHEYHIESEVGEDKVFTCAKCSKSVSIDLFSNEEKKNIKQEGLCKIIDCSQSVNLNEKEKNEVIEFKRCIEVGHTFVLGDRYTKFFPIELEMKNGTTTSIIMGCYGIGVSRLMQSTVEFHQVDKHFPNWPLEIAPFQIAIIPAKRGSKEDEKSQKLVAYFCDMFESNHLFKDEVYVDDRVNMTIGARLVDTKLIGIPYACILGKHIHDDQVEIAINSTTLQKALGKSSLLCHTRELAHVLKQLNNDYLYSKKENKLASYFKNLN